MLAAVYLFTLALRFDAHPKLIQYTPSHTPCRDTFSHGLSKWVFLLTHEVVYTCVSTGEQDVKISGMETR